MTSKQKNLKAVERFEIEYIIGLLENINIKSNNPDENTLVITNAIKKYFKYNKNLEAIIKKTSIAHLEHILNTKEVDVGTNFISNPDIQFDKFQEETINVLKTDNVEDFENEFNKSPELNKDIVVQENKKVSIEELIDNSNDIFQTYDEILMNFDYKIEPNRMYSSRECPFPFSINKWAETNNIVFFEKELGKHINDVEIVVWYNLFAKTMKEYLTEKAKEIKVEDSQLEINLNYLKTIFNLNEAEIKFIRFIYYPQVFPNSPIKDITIRNNYWNMINRVNQEYFNLDLDSSISEEFMGNLFSGKTYSYKNKSIMKLRNAELISMNDNGPHELFTESQKVLELFTENTDEFKKAFFTIIDNKNNIPLTDFKLSKEFSKILNKSNFKVLLNHKERHGSEDLINSIAPQHIEVQLKMSTFSCIKSTNYNKEIILAGLREANESNSLLVIRDLDRMYNETHDASFELLKDIVKPLKEHSLPIILLQENIKTKKFNDILINMDYVLNLNVLPYEVKEVNVLRLLKEKRIKSYLSNIQVKQLIFNIQLDYSHLSNLYDEVSNVYSIKEETQDFISLMIKRYEMMSPKEFSEFEVGKSLDFNSFNLEKDIIAVTKKLITKKGVNILIKANAGKGAEEFVNSCGKEAQRNIISINLLNEFASDKSAETNYERVKKGLEYAEQSNKILLIDNFISPFVNTPISSGTYQILDDTINLLKEHKGLVFIILPFNSKVKEDVASLFSYKIEFHGISLKQRKAVWDFCLENYPKLDFINPKQKRKLASNFNIDRNQIKSVLKVVDLLDYTNNAEAYSTLLNILERQYENTKNPFIGNDFNEDRYNLDFVNSDTNLKEVYEDVKKHFNNLSNPDENMQGEVSYNILMYGKAGTGKTEYAHSLANETDRSLMKMKASDILGPMLPMTLNNIKSVFKMAEMEQAILLIDEADSLFCDRYDPNVNEEKKTITNELLTQMEAFKGVLVCSTNLKGILDPASIRRFTKKIKFSYLDFKQRKAFYNIFFKDVNENEIDEENLKRLEFLRDLSIGDFKTVHQQVKFQKQPVEHSVILSLLKKEMEEKFKMSGTKVIPLNEKKYDLSCINTDANLNSVLRTSKKYYQYLFNNTEEVEIPNRNMLLYGVAGSGKTELAKYIAQQVGVRLMVIKGADIKSKWVGEAEQNLRKKFTEAEEAGAMILFDEADALVKNRNFDKGNGGDLTNELLTYLENFKGICILSTNFKESFDNAVLRRLTYKIKFDYIENEAKLKFFTIYLKDLTGKELTNGQKDTLCNIRHLTAGDFKTIHNKHFFDKGAEWLNNDLILDDLSKEVENRVPKKLGLAN